MKIGTVAVVPVDMRYGHSGFAEALSWSLTVRFTDRETFVALRPAVGARVPLEVERGESDKLPAGIYSAIVHVLEEVVPGQYFTATLAGYGVGAPR
jgi:hypothetical protein